MLERTSADILREISGIRSRKEELSMANDCARYSTPGSAEISVRNAQIAALEVRLSELAPLYWEARRAEGLGGPFEDEVKTMSHV